ncbi:uncharacterized protein LOC141531746 [Cotesia typhae]|uniref:uncharacterized protein LOC141531746 n=1 Tax=Cotesia typhae TaxID=2053667 RepID=UPI003D68476A
MNKSPFSTPRGRGQNGHQKPYYRKQRSFGDYKNLSHESPTNNSSQEDKNLNTSGSSDDYIPFNNSLPSPFNKSLPSPSLASPPAVSTFSPFFHVQKQGTQFYGQHLRYSLGHESPSHSPRGRGSFNKSFSPGFNNRTPKGKNTNQYQRSNNYQGKNYYQGRNQYQGKKETNIYNYIDQSFFEDPWAELVIEFDSLNQSSSTDKFDDSFMSQSLLEDSMLKDEEDDKESGSDCKDADSQDEIFPMSQEDPDPIGE